MDIHKIDSNGDVYDYVTRLRKYPNIVGAKKLVDSDNYSVYELNKSLDILGSYTVRMKRKKAREEAGEQSMSDWAMKELERDKAESGDSKEHDPQFNVDDEPEYYQRNPAKSIASNGRIRNDDDLFEDIAILSTKSQKVILIKKDRNMLRNDFISLRAFFDVSALVLNQSSLGSAFVLSVLDSGAALVDTTGHPLNVGMIIRNGILKLIVVKKDDANKVSGSEEIMLAKTSEGMEVLIKSLTRAIRDILPSTGCEGYFKVK